MGWPNYTNHLLRFQAVVNACKQLDTEEKPITNDAVREILGGGSLRDISPIVRSYIEQRDVIARFEQLKPDLAHLLLSAANNAFLEMQQQLTTAVSQVEATIGISTAESAQRELERNTEINRLHEELRLSKRQLEDAAHEIAALKTKRDTLERELTAVMAVCASQTTEIQQLKTAIETSE